MEKPIINPKQIRDLNTRHQARAQVYHVPILTEWGGLQQLTKGQVQGSPEAGGNTFSPGTGGVSAGRPVRVP